MNNQRLNDLALKLARHSYRGVEVSTADIKLAAEYAAGHTPSCSAVEAERVIVAILEGDGLVRLSHDTHGLVARRFLEFQLGDRFPLGQALFDHLDAAREACSATITELIELSVAIASSRIRSDVGSRHESKYPTSEDRTGTAD